MIHLAGFVMEEAGQPKYMKAKLSPGMYFLKINTI